MGSGVLRDAVDSLCAFPSAEALGYFRDAPPALFLLGRASAPYGVLF